MAGGGQKLNVHVGSWVENIRKDNTWFEKNTISKVTGIRMIAIP